MFRGEVRLFLFCILVLFDKEGSGSKLNNQQTFEPSKVVSSDEKLLDNLNPTLYSFVPYEKKESKDAVFDASGLSRNYYSSQESYDYPVHYATYVSQGSGYNPLAIIAITIFGLLFTILILEAFGIATFRSMPYYSSPLSFNKLSYAASMVPEVLNKVLILIEETPWESIEPLLEPIKKFNENKNVTELLSNRKRRGKRGLISDSESFIGKSIRLIRKDPSDLQCIRKFACETLAGSEMIKSSVKSSIGATVMKMIGRSTESGPEIYNLVNDVIGDPEKCAYLAQEGLCDS